ncbi:MAG: hypothetical protein QOH06_471 [Acidobacteriota bacterium]|jgi:hypothetical protein|nr:hypothetical protein [Acidobacteriota bacterium]
MGIQWSKLKKQVEQRFAPSVAGRVELRTTNYRHAHDSTGRGWITVDKTEVHNFCTLKYWVEHNALASGIREANSAMDWRDPAQRAGYYEAGDQADAILEMRGVVTQSWFEDSLQDFLSLSIEDALQSENFLHRALSILDARLGKRRLRSLEFGPEEHPLVRRFLALRQEAEHVGEGFTRVSRQLERLG